MNNSSTRKSKRKGFTLAEVLITLGIIGVVAAITIPTLMQNIQDKQFKESAKVAYSKASQVVQQMKVNDGGWDENMACNIFAYKFSSYFKKLDGYDLTNWNYGMWKRYIPADNNSVYKTFSNPVIFARTGEMTFQFITTDGMLWSTDYWDDTSLTYKFMVTVDVNGYQKGPNIFGRDVFVFQVVNSHLLPMGANNTKYAVTDITSIQHNCTREGAAWAQQGQGCMEYVMEDKDY